jgi:hydrogenase-4 component B
MNELLVCLAIVLTGTSGIVALFGGTRPGADRYFSMQMGLGALVGLVGALHSLLGFETKPWRARWNIPYGLWHVHVDGLASVFLLSIFLLGTLGAIYNEGYFPVEKHHGRAVRLRLFYGLIVAGMALLVIAKNSLLFLVGWEVMAVAAFFALSVEDYQPDVRAAGLVYLVATRLGTLLIIAAFVLLRLQANDFSLALTGLNPNTGLATATFLVGLVGFGLKAGIMPLHLWLPGAHANAPTHVSALMSGVLIKMGIFGILRLTSFYESIPLWWAHVILGLGLISALLGVAFALGQHDFKRLLAYHSIENIGIILLGIAIGMLGRAKEQPVLVALGYGGALLHVVNHGLFKALLFFGAGSVIEATGTRDLEQYGALARRLPLTAFAFLIGAAAITGLPPLNGFVSELYLYLGMLRAQSLPIELSGIALAFAIPVLAMVGALALACFVKVYAVAFLGEPRTERSLAAKEAPRSMLLPQVVLASLCVLIGLFPQVPLRILLRAIENTVGSTSVGASFPSMLVFFNGLSQLSVINIGLVVFALLFSLRLRRSSAVPSKKPTWDCGYAVSTARIQYTASSVAADLVGMFAVVLRPRTKSTAIEGVFPDSSTFNSHVPEVVLDLFVMPTLRRIARVIGWLRHQQRGSVHFYLLLVLLTLLVMLAVWR